MSLLVLLPVSHPYGLGEAEGEGVGEGEAVGDGEAVRSVVSSVVSGPFAVAGV